MIDGGRNSPDEDVTPSISSMHLPPLLTRSGSSLKAPRHISPKLPLSAIPSTKRGATPVPLTLIEWGLNRSLLKIVIVPVRNPTAAGLNRTARLIDAPGLTSIG